MEDRIMSEKGKINISGRLLSGQTAMGQYVAYFERLVEEDRELFEKAYKKLVDEKAGGRGRVFLSIIIRTQGKRIEGLREAFLCLEAQTDQDFEVILVCHKILDENRESVEGILKELSPNMRKKVTCIKVDEGTRATPINYGFANARGSYVSVYDDDDLLFANYVEEFHEAVKFADGRLLHAYAFAQDWEENSDILGGNGYCAVGAPQARYCRKFDQVEQTSVNGCPLMSIAFPAYLFRDYGILFDESLDIMEDWEYIMRVSPLCGVYDIEEATSIYRFWKNMENSTVIHSQGKWDSVYSKLRKEIAQRPLVFLGASSKALGKAGQQNIYAVGYPRMQGVLFCDLGDGFSDANIVRAENQLALPEFCLKFKVPDRYKNTVRLRIDPSEYGGMILRDCRITVSYLDGTQETMELRDCQHNGALAGRDVYFMHYDPMFLWQNAAPVKEVEVKGYVSMEIPEQYIQQEIQRQCREYHRLRLKKSRLGRLLAKICRRWKA